MQAQMETMAKEKGDMFDTMVVDEAKIRLGEDGWKERYYQVSYLLFYHCTTVSKPAESCTAWIACLSACPCY